MISQSGDKPTHYQGIAGCKVLCLMRGSPEGEVCPERLDIPQEGNAKGTGAVCHHVP